MAQLKRGLIEKRLKREILLFSIGDVVAADLGLLSRIINDDGH
jgi:hypothetical protein